MLNYSDNASRANLALPTSVHTYFSVLAHFIFVGVFCTLFELVKCVGIATTLAHAIWSALHTYFLQCVTWEVVNNAKL